MAEPRGEEAQPVTRASSVAGGLRGYDSTSYGAAFADVYDDWYDGVSPVDTTVATLTELCGHGPVLELGVGTGRLAIPLGRKVAITGIDASPEMLDVLRRRDVDGIVSTVQGDMVNDLPGGPFSLVFVAYNTFFNLTADGAQQRCFAAVHDRLTQGGRFAIEAFVPTDPAPDGDQIDVRSMTADRVVLSISRFDGPGQRADGQFIEFTESAARFEDDTSPSSNQSSRQSRSQRPGVRLRPWSIRYARPAQLDEMAAAAGFELEYRWADFARSPFNDDADRHVSVYRCVR